VPIGLDDMGLVLRTAVVQEPNGCFGVELTLRLTAPGCLFFIDFEQRASRTLVEHGAAWVRVAWDTEFDWSPGDMSDSAQDRLAEHRRALGVPSMPGSRRSSDIRLIPVG
jgi:metal-sulfur cluster biosynthetic enzyme